jgi:uncharacterized protein (DUF1778 family)
MGPLMKSEIVNLRLTQEQKAAIDYAAKLAGITRTEFMVMAAVERAMDERYDGVRFTLPKEDFNYLMDQLSDGVTPNQLTEVEKMRSVKLPWEK